MEFIWEDLPFDGGDGSAVLRHFADGGDVYDAREKVLLIGDVSLDEDDRPRLNGVMTAPFDPAEFAAMGLWDALDDPVGWALGSLPAPGTCAPNRMGFMDAQTAAETVAANPSDFFNASRGAFAVTEQED